MLDSSVGHTATAQEHDPVNSFGEKSNIPNAPTNHIYTGDDMLQRPHTMLGRPVRPSRTTYIPSIYESDNETKKFNYSHKNISQKSSYPNFHSQSQTGHGLYNGSYFQSYSTFPESFIAVDPYRATVSPYAHRYDIASNKSQLGETASTGARATYSASELDNRLSRYILAFMLETIPRQLYLYCLLGLPSLYFSRVTRIFEEAEMTMPEIRQMAVETTTQWADRFPSIEPAVSSPLYMNFKFSWESFIDSLMREWKTLNIVSVLLLSAILTMLQIDSAAAEPLTRYSALLSLVCTLMGLLYGCMYIIRFSSMRKTYKAAQWAEEAQKTTTSILWNVWVMLAMPAVWLSWAIILYIVCIMSFVWRTGAETDQAIPLTSNQALGPRILISIVLAVGIICFGLIMVTFRRYGDLLDMAWRDRVINWSQEKASITYHRSVPPSSYKSSLSEYTSRGRGSDYNPSEHLAPGLSYEPSVNRTWRSASASPHRKNDTASNYTVPASVPTSGRTTPDVPLRKPAKAMDLRFLNSVGYNYPNEIMVRGIRPEAWTKFLDDIASVWDGNTENILDVPIPVHSRRPQDLTGLRLDWWNRNLFFQHQLQAVLCLEYPKKYPESPLFAVYVIDYTTQGGIVDPIDTRFGIVPEDFERIDILDPFTATNYDTRRLNLGRTVLLAPDKPRAAGVRFGRSFDDQIIPAISVEGESGEEYNDDGQADEEDNGTGTDDDESDGCGDDSDKAFYDDHGEPHIFIRPPTPVATLSSDKDQELPIDSNQAQQRSWESFPTTR